MTDKGAPHPEEGNRFDRLCDAFDERLSSDGEELAGLYDELAAETADAPTIVQRLQMLSHRVAGAAALFGRKNIMHAASALEQAAIDALLPRPACDRARLLSAIRALLESLPPAGKPRPQS